MAVTYGSTPMQLWQCLSTDTKPSGSAVQLNDALYVTDTQTWYLWNGSTWNVSNTPPVLRPRR